MALTINTNISALIAQRNFDKATSGLNSSIERMSTGYKINHAVDNAAGYSISNMWVTQLGSLDIAADNAATGADMLTTLEDTYTLIISHVQRVRDLAEQAANGTYGTASTKAINAEMEARFSEIDRIAKNAEFNGIALMKSGAATINLQVGIKADTNSQIALAGSLFEAADLTAIQSMGTFTGNSAAALAKECSGYTDGTTPNVDHNKPFRALTKLDACITNLSSRVTNIGAAQNRVESAITSIDVQTQNLTSSLSTLRDTDIADESSKYIQAQILQQASATLLSTANQLPSIALNLI
jgi:flagellin